MAYQIRYDTSGEIVRTRPGRKRLAAFICGFFLLFLLLTHAFWPSGADTLRKLFLPGEPEATAAAMDSLISGLKDGEPLTVAVTAFCREIIDYAENSD